MKSRIMSIILLITLIVVFFASCTKPEQPPTVAELLDIGEKYLLNMDYEQAAVYFSKLIEIEPMNPRGYMGLAKVYIALDETDKAEAVLKQGLGVLPNNDEIAKLLSEIVPTQSPEPPPTSEPSSSPEPSVDISPKLEPSTEPTPTPTPVPTSQSGVESYEFMTELTSDTTEVNAEYLTIRVHDSRTATITISNVPVDDTYITNLDSSRKDASEYSWKVEIHTEQNAYSVSTSNWAFEPGRNEEKSVMQMQHSVWVHNGSSWPRIGDAEMRYTYDSMTWVFTIPDDYPFDFSEVSMYKVNVWNIFNNTRIERIYLLTSE